MTLHHTALAAHDGGQICARMDSGPPENIGNIQLTKDQFNGKCPPEQQVPITSLDAAIPAGTDVFFLKADCEGCEPSAIIGGKQLFLSASPTCVVNNKLHICN